LKDCKRTFVKEVFENKLTEKDKEILRNCGIDYECDKCDECKKIIDLADEKRTGEVIDFQNKLNTVHFQMMCKNKDSN